MILCRSASWYVCFVISVRHFLIIKKGKRKRQRCKKKTQKWRKSRTRQKKSERKEEEKKEEQNSEVLASFVSFCRVVWLLAWTRSRTSLGRRHRLAWDYFSVLQFWIELLIFLATILCLPKLLIYTSVSTGSPCNCYTQAWKLIVPSVGFGKNTCKTVVSRLRYCFPLSPLSSSC